MNLVKLPLSVAIISFNEEENIERTLQSISKIASEIILVDSDSTDRTVEIALRFGAKVFIETWKGYIEQKNSALAKCSQPWIFALDCDEVPDETLLISISNAIAKDKKVGFLVRRRTFYLGKLLKRAWQPDWKLRLVRKDCNPRWEGIEPHDELKVDTPVEKLKGNLIHYSYKDLSHHFEKTFKYARLSAKAYAEKGISSNIFKILFNPMFAFIKNYFLRGWFLDGIRGLFAGVSSYLSTFLKYSFLLELLKFGSKDD